MSRTGYCPGCLWALLLVSALAGTVRAESIPPPTLDELLGADCVAVGRFVKQDGSLRFLPARLLRGKGDAIDAIVKKGALPIQQGEGGKLIVRQDWRALAVHEYDAAANLLWFFSSARRSVPQPAELADGFAALLGGKQPDATFRLFQDLDFDMRREALEQLFASRDIKLVACLHDVALQRDSELASRAVDALVQTHLLDAERFWGKWLDHPAGHKLQRVLQARAPERVTAEMLKAIASEKRPAWLAQLLHELPQDRPAYVDANLAHLAHPAEDVRQQVVWNVYNLFCRLASEARTSTQARERVAALGKRALPLLEARLKAEKSERVRRNLAEMVARKDGVAWVFRVPTEYEPLPPYSDAEEMKLLVNQLTSTGGRGFVMEAAGRELAERFFAAAFAQLKEAAASPNFNSDLVYDGMGYVRHPRMFGHLVDHVKGGSVGDRTYAAALRGIGRQNDRLSLGVLAGELIQGRLQGQLTEGTAAAMFDALGALRDERALDVLKGKDVEAAAKEHAQLRYVRARAMHGDLWAVKELLTALANPDGTAFLKRDWYTTDGILEALLWVDTPEATAALKRHVAENWPKRTRWGALFDTVDYLSLDMENYAGSARRTTPVGEVARRDPPWLAELALEQMAAPTVRARVSGARVFRQLTGQVFDYRATAFAAERTAPLKKVQDWWAAHKTTSRDKWLLSYFREQRFAMKRLHERASLPILAQVLAADDFTHNLAVEQISVITGKYFQSFQSHAHTYRGQEKATQRVLGWLRARQLLPPASGAAPAGATN